MPSPIRPLPIAQNWDCHVSGSCCKEYQVPVTDDERRRIEEQGWAAREEFRGVPLFRSSGPPWARQLFLNHRPDGSCVFLNAQGRCRIHEQFGFAAKPLPCRLYPFVLVPCEDHYRVGVRFACPSAARNLGRPLAEHDKDLREFAALLEQREGVAQHGGPRAVPPPPLAGRQKVSWPDLLRFSDALRGLLRDRRYPVERRLRQCLTLDGMCRQARFDRVQGARLSELLDMLTAHVVAEVPPAAEVVPPRSSGRLLFRQAAALFTRKDRGPNRGPATRGRLGLLAAALRFARGRGVVPRLHAGVPEMTFAAAEQPAGPLPADAEELLERYYLVKIGSMQFCGATNFGLPFWDGLEMLLVTCPIVMWLRRGFAAGPQPIPPADAVARALTIVDDNFGYHPVLGTARQQTAFRILARTGDLDRLIAWYSR